MKVRALLVCAALFALACKDHEDRVPETALKDNLSAMRRAIDAHETDRGSYPKTLQDLVPKYLSKVPVDPLTNAADWRVTTEETVVPNSDFQTTTVTSEAPASVVIDVHSSAPGKDRNGVPYANY